MRRYRLNVAGLTKPVITTPDPIEIRERIVKIKAGRDVHPAYSDLSVEVYGSSLEPNAWTGLTPQSRDALWAAVRTRLAEEGA